MAGAITGFVTDAAGVPQMGAAVLLFNRQERQFERALTDDRGAFRFLGLTPDLYSIKVTLAAFVPAMKKGILVQPGMAQRAQREPEHALQLHPVRLSAD